MILIEHDQMNNFIQQLFSNLVSKLARIPYYEKHLSEINVNNLTEVLSKTTKRM
jgi:hypothetical protein